MLKFRSLFPVVSLLTLFALAACSEEPTESQRRAPGKKGTSADNTTGGNTDNNNSDSSGNTDTNTLPVDDTTIPSGDNTTPQDPGSSNPPPSGDPTTGGGNNAPPPAGSTYGDKIVAIARAELGRSVADVGKDRQGEPGRLQPLLLSATEPWCSEFVSWAYKIAGNPLTGGTKNGQPDWMLTSTVRLRSYFQEKKRWVQAGSPEWNTYSPKAGDYIRYNAGSGHSGIVQRTEGTTLITVEGNWSKMVKEGPKKDWRIKYQEYEIDGIGILEPSKIVCRNGIINILAS